MGKHGGPWELYDLSKDRTRPPTISTTTTSTRCVKSPFVDDGGGHSPLIDFALDGFPVYGPYVAKGLMAKDYKDEPLDDFNMRHDDERGWYYHVTPGKYPDMIGGFAGAPDPRNVRRGPPELP